MHRENRSTRGSQKALEKVNLTTSEETADSQKQSLPTKTCTLSSELTQERLSSLKRPIGLEIGFGMGEQFVEWACSVSDLASHWSGVI